MLYMRCLLYICFNLPGFCFIFVLFLVHSFAIIEGFSEFLLMSSMLTFNVYTFINSLLFLYFHCFSSCSFIISYLGSSDYTFYFLFYRLCVVMLNSLSLSVFDNLPIASQFELELCIKYYYNVIWWYNIIILCVCLCVCMCLCMCVLWKDFFTLFHNILDLCAFSSEL